MTRVYANDKAYIATGDVVEEFKFVYSFKETNYPKYAVMYKEFCNMVRDQLGISNMIVIFLKEEEDELLVVTYNIVANDYDFYFQGQDEFGLYVEVGE